MAEALADAAVWYAVAFALSALLYPAVFRATPGLPDRGLTLAGPLGLLLAVIGPWWTAAVGIAPFTDSLLLGLPVVVGVALWTWEIRRGELLPYLRRRLGALIGWQVLTLALFLGYVVFRGFNPDAAYTEKPMDMAFLASAIRATEMPPPDPWFAGEPINYYYLGYVLMAALARLAGSAPGVAFSLSLATIFAYATIAAAGSAANLVRAARPEGTGRVATWLAGALGAILLVGVGNLVTPLRFLRAPRATLAAGWWDGVGWQASRVIVDRGIPGSTEPRPTINEFPAFSFILGDLHPHVLAYPLFIAVVGLVIGLYFQVSQDREGKDERPLVWPVTASGIVAGALFAVNAWDLPTALALAGGALLLGMGWCRRRRALSAFAFVIGVAVATALPFALGYTPPVGAIADEIPAAIAEIPVIGRLVSTVGIVIWPRSPARSLLTVHGLFLAITLVAVAALWSLTPRARRPDGRLVFAAVPAVVLGWALHFAALWVIALPIAGLVVLLRRARVAPGFYAAAALLAFGWGVVLVPEVVFLQDAFGDRMNTVFKAYFQAWAILAIAGAAALVIALPHLRRGLGRAPAWVAGGAIAAIILGAALYPPLSAYRWSDGFHTWRGIDALDYIGRANPAEGAAIDWLAAHARPGDVVLEAPGCSYGVAHGLPHDRVAMATGLPTLIGWNFHEYQWRSGRPAEVAAITQRQEDANTIYRDPTSERARVLLDTYGVRYIYVGVHEREGYGQGCTVGPPYSDTSLDAFDQIGWQRVFAEGGVTLYERPIEAPQASRPN